MAARQARDFVAATMRAWDLPDYIDTVQLLTSELVTNGVLHAGTTLELQVTAGTLDLTIEVHDHDHRAPVSRGHRLDLLADIDLVLAAGVANEPDDRDATMPVGAAGPIGAGRGLLLVETLADEWGVAETAVGKSVWFRLHVA
jgi:hypothetical protein